MIRETVELCDLKTQARRIEQAMNTRKTKSRLATLTVDSLIRPVVRYGHETWTPRQEDERALGLFERRVLRSIYDGVRTETRRVAIVR